MSIKVMTWVFDHSRTAGGERLVALSLADNADDYGRCWPSIELTARKALVSRATVKRATRRMIALGELKVTDRGKHTNLYRFTCGLKLTPQDDMSPQAAPVVGSNATAVVGSNASGCGLTHEPLNRQEPSTGEPSVGTEGTDPPRARRATEESASPPRAQRAPGLRSAAASKTAPGRGTPTPTPAPDRLETGSWDDELVPPEPSGPAPTGAGSAEPAPGPARADRTRSGRSRPVSEKIGGWRDGSPEFLRFLAQHPRAVKKQEAWVAWCRLNPDAAVVAEIMAALAWQAETAEWHREGRRFVPAPATYLNSRRWEDDPPAPTSRLSREPERTQRNVEAVKDVIELVRNREERRA